jgi:hypothetical protein
MAESLAAAPELAGGGSGIVRTPIEARAVSAARATAIPLPVSGNFNGIDWEAAGGPITTWQLEQTLEYNAICQWVRAAHAGRHADIARAVLAVVDRWPAVAPDANRGPGRPLGSEMLLRECAASHRREVAYARALGLPPST